MRNSTLYILLVLSLAATILQACKKGHTDTPPVQNNTTFRTVGYLEIERDDAFDVAQHINFNELTHLNLAFVNPDATGNFADNDAIQQIVQLAHGYKVKVLMSIAGGASPGYFAKLLTDDNRAAFISAIGAMVTKYNLDGVDVDLEGNAVNENYTKFVTDLSASLAPQGELVTAAVATWFAPGVTDSALAKFDFINIMSYDKTGPWAPADPGPHSPYYMAVNDLNYWGNTRGVAKEKMNVGVPFYGYGFGNGRVSSMSYGDIVSQYKDAENKDEITLRNGQTMYYNGIPTIQRKTTLAMQEAGGIMIWELSQDSHGDKSLLKGIYDVVQGQ